MLVFLFSLIALVCIFLASEFTEYKTRIMNTVSNIVTSMDRNKRRENGILECLANFKILKNENKEFQLEILSRLEKEIKKSSIGKSKENMEIFLDNILDIFGNVGSRHAEKNMEMLRVLNDFPESLVKYSIKDYDSGVNYENEFNHVMRVLNKNISKSSFYKNNFLFKLTEYIKEFLQSSMDQLDHEFYDLLLKLFIKWATFKASEYTIKKMTINTIINDVNGFCEFFSSIDKSKINYRFEYISFQNYSISPLIQMEIVENWELLLDDFKSICNDFYLKGHDRKYIIDNYFHGNSYHNPLLTNFIEINGSRKLLRCILRSEKNCKASQLYSQEEVDKMTRNLFMKFEESILNDYELKLVIGKGHLVKIGNDRKEFMKLISRLNNLDLLTEENLKKIRLSDQELTRERMLEMTKEIEKEDDQDISEKLKGLFIV